MMRTDVWARVNPVLDGVLDLPPRERYAFMRQSCGGDLTVEREVKRVLRCSELAAGGVLDRPAVELGAPLLEPSGDVVLDRYELVRPLGAGGMGVVFLARDRELDRLVALKFLPFHVAADPEAIQRFRNEARAASALDHPNIAAVHDIAEAEDGRLFIIMGFYEGETLRGRIARGPLAPFDAHRLAAELAGGLSAAHAAGVVHRDIKPSNILLTADGARILDFGVAKTANPLLTDSQVTLGTVPYMSPEQTRGEKQVGPPTDIWSLGVLLYEMLTGRRPFAAPTPEAVIQAIRNDEPEPLLQLRPDLPASLVRVVERCLEKDALARHPDAASLAKELRRIQDLVDSDLDRRVAVMPFDYFGSDPSEQYLADGTTEELIGRLSKLSGVRVIARTSVMTYRDGEMDTARIGEELGVGTLISGSVRRAGDRVRIAIVLIEVETQEAMWTDELEADAAELLDLQIRLAERAAVALGVHMQADERRQLARRRPEDAAAYDEYLQGRHLLAASDPNPAEARRRFERALALDSSFAGAWSGLADAYNPASHMVPFPTDAECRQSRRAAERALELDPESAEAHTSLAVVLTSHYWDSEGAERSFQRAIQLDPSYARAHATYAEHLQNMGRFEEARVRARTAAELDPNDYLSQVELATIAYMEGRYDDAVVRARDLARRGPEYAGAWFFVGLALIQLGRFDEALAALDEADPDHVLGHPLAIRGHAYALTGDHERARWILATFEDRPPGARSFAFDRAVVHMGLGESERAVGLLERAVERRDWRVRLLRVEPVFGSVRSTTSFSRVLERGGLSPQ